MKKTKSCYVCGVSKSINAFEKDSTACKSCFKKMDGFDKTLYPLFEAALKSDTHFYTRVLDQICATKNYEQLCKDIVIERLAKKGILAKQVLKRFTSDSETETST